MDSEFIQQLYIIFNNPSIDIWTQLIIRDELLYLKIANSAWNPSFNDNELYRLYTSALNPFKQQSLQWLIENHPLKCKTTILALCHTITRTPAESHTEKKESVKVIYSILNLGRPLFGDTEFISVIFTLLCEPTLVDLSRFMVYKQELGKLIEYPADINSFKQHEKHKLYNDIAAISKHPENYDRVSLLFSLFLIGGEDLGEIIYRIRGRAQGCVGTILPTMRFIVNRYMCCMDAYELPFIYCIPDNHAHDYETFSYLIKVIDKPIIDVSRCVKKVVCFTNTIDEFQNCLNHFGWPVDFFVRNINNLYQEGIQDSDEKLSNIILRCNKGHIERIRYFFEFLTNNPEPTKKYFYYLLFKHYETIAKLVKKRIFRKWVKQWCKKCNMMCQLSMIPDGIFGNDYYFPGGTIYLQIMARCGGVKLKTKIVHNNE